MDLFRSGLVGWDCDVGVVPQEVAAHLWALRVAFVVGFERLVVGR